MISVPFFIAKRYFFSKKNTGFIHIISWMSFLGVALGTAALVIALSVFNGLEDLIRDIYGSFNPDIKIELLQGKSFDSDIFKNLKIENISPNDKIVYVIEDNALVRYLDKQVIVKIKGLSNNYDFSLAPLMNIQQGVSTLMQAKNECAVVGVGIQNKLGFNIDHNYINLQCWYPKLEKNVHSNPMEAFQTENIGVVGSFALEKLLDDTYILVPLAFAARLMNYGNSVNAVEIFLKDKSTCKKVQNELIQKFEKKFSIKNADQQNQSMLRAIEIEKLFIYVVFCFILAVCSLNIFFSLSMLAIEKRKDIRTLVALGADGKFIKNIFLLNGYLIGVVGAVSGLLLGYCICFLQQNFGLISMGTQTGLVNYYPISLRLTDFIFTGVAILIITSVICYFPAQKAKDFVDKNYG